jgi:hypothetical protein
VRGLRFTFRRSVAACIPIELLLDADGLEELSVGIDFFRVTGTVHVSDSVSYRCGREFFCFSTLFSAYTAPVVLESGAAGRAVARRRPGERGRPVQPHSDSHRAHGTRGKRQPHSPDYQPNRRPPPQSESERGEPAAPTATRDAREQSPRPRLGDGEVIGEV